MPNQMASRFYAAALLAVAAATPSLLTAQQNP